MILKTKPMNNQKYQKLVKRIRKLCPELVEYHPGDKLKTDPQYHSITLEHVLKALGKTYNIEVSIRVWGDSGDIKVFVEFEDKDGEQGYFFDWLTGKPLRDQTQETKDWLAGLLIND